MKLNRFTSVLLTCLILVSNMGLALNVHYCGGRVSEVSFTYKTDEACKGQHTEEKTCCALKEKSHKSCCKNDVVKLQDKTDNVIVKTLQLDLSSFCAYGDWKPLPFYGNTVVVKKETPSFYCESNAPPLFKLYCRYILYA